MGKGNTQLHLAIAFRLAELKFNGPLNNTSLNTAGQLICVCFYFNKYNLSLLSLGFTCADSTNCRSKTAFLHIPPKYCFQSAIVWIHRFQRANFSVKSYTWLFDHIGVNTCTPTMFKGQLYSTGTVANHPLPVWE